jgi:hypothetical protein
MAGEWSAWTWVRVHSVRPIYRAGITLPFTGGRPHAAHPSLGRLWSMFKALLVQDEDIDRRDLVLAQHAFYTGARAILKIQAFLLARGRYDELHATPMRRSARELCREILVLEGG